MLTLQNLMNGLISGKIKSNDGVGKCIVRIYPKVHKSMNLGVVSRILEKELYVLVLDVQGKYYLTYLIFICQYLLTKFHISDIGGIKVDVPVGIVTAMDLLEFISANQNK